MFANRIAVEAARTSQGWRYAGKELLAVWQAVVARKNTREPFLLCFSRCRATGCESVRMLGCALASVGDLLSCDAERHVTVHGNFSTPGLVDDREVRLAGEVFVDLDETNKYSPRPSKIFRAERSGFMSRGSVLVGFLAREFWCVGGRSGGNRCRAESKRGKCAKARSLPAGASKNPDGTTTEFSSPDPGRALITGDATDFFESRNAFKIPSLWGVARTAPYFHDNSSKT